MKSKKVLFIDDEELATGYYRKALKEGGFDVKFFDDIDKAVASIEAGDAYDLLILDMMMPPGRFHQDNQEGDQTGYMFLRWYRTERKGSALAFILTNVNDEEILGNAESLTSVTVLSKTSVMPGQLVELVRDNPF